MTENIKHHLPFLSVVLPVYNEEGFLEECLSSLVNQDYPKELVEILVVDGMSTDRTQDIVKGFCNRYSYIRMINNAQRITAAALNIGIKVGRGEFIIRVDGHSFYYMDFLGKSVKYLLKTHSYCVGGPVNAVGTCYRSKAISFAMSSRFGIGNAQQHYRLSEGYLDTVPFPAYKRELFYRIGVFDEEVSARARLEKYTLLRKLKLRWCNEDDDFNYRLRESGGKIYFTPEIKSHYYPRSSLKALWRQYFQYGFWKVRVLQRNRRMIRVRHLVPAAFVLGLLGSGSLGLFLQPFVFLFYLIASSYLVASLLFSITISLDKGWRYFLLLPIVFATMHLGYGSGFLVGEVIFADRWFGKVKEKQSIHIQEQEVLKCGRS